MDKVKFAWYTTNEETDDDGLYLQGELAEAAERRSLVEMGAPDVDQIEFASILPEDRDGAICEALVTPAFRDWGMFNETTNEIAKSEAENGDTRLVFYNE